MIYPRRRALVNLWPLVLVVNLVNKMNGVPADGPVNIKESLVDQLPKFIVWN